jgi:hypothetical protein
VNRAAEAGGAQRAEIGEFAGSDGIALEAGMLVEVSAGLARTGTVR